MCLARRHDVSPMCYPEASRDRRFFVSYRSRKMSFLSVIAALVVWTAAMVAGAANDRKPWDRPLLADHRIVTYYGHPLSARMGTVGHLPPAQVVERLAAESARWQRADPKARVLPGLEVVAVGASSRPEFDGRYRATTATSSRPGRT